LGVFSSESAGDSLVSLSFDGRPVFSVASLASSRSSMMGSVSGALSMVDSTVIVLSFLPLRKLKEGFFSFLFDAGVEDES
jgi:hypothetical protein